MHFIAKLNLCCYFVALSYRNLTHVVTKAGNFQTLTFSPAQRRTTPVINLILYFRALPVSNYHLALFTHACTDEAKFAVTVCTLVRIHVVHINVVPWQGGIKLSV